MGHGGGRGGAVPMLFARREGDDVAGPNLLDWAALVLRPAAASGDDEGLAERMGVPGGARRRVRLEQRVDADHAGEPVRRPLGRRLRAASLDVHASLLLLMKPAAPGLACGGDLRTLSVPIESEPGSKSFL